MFFFLHEQIAGSNPARYTFDNKVSFSQMEQYVFVEQALVCCGMSSV